MRAQRRREAAASSLAEGMRQRQQAQGAGAGAAAEDRGGAGASELAALNKEVGELRSALAEAKQAALAAANPPPPPPDPATPAVGGEEAGPLLVIAVNTIPRPSDEDYLMQALDSISAQLKDGDNSVAVYVLNLRPGKHAVFAAAQKRYGADGR